MLAADALVHPCAAALLRARVQIDEEAAAARAVGVEDVVEAHVRVIDVDAGALGDAHAVELLRDREHAREHARQREVRPQRFFGQIEALALSRSA